jgi:hypothetical protein
MKSELKFWRWAAVIAVLALGIVGSIAVAAPKGGGGGNSSSTTTTPNGGLPAPPANGPRDGRGLRFHLERRGPAAGLSDLAKQLGVSTSKLRDALEAVHSDLGPPTPPSDGSPPSKADMEKRCTQETDALASKLGKSGDDVRAAIKTVLENKIEAAVKAKDLTRAQADKMIARINDAACLPAFGGPPHHGGCRGGHGPGRGHGPGDAGFGGPPPRGGTLAPAPAPSTGSGNSTAL